MCNFSIFILTFYEGRFCKLTFEIFESIFLFNNILLNILIRYQICKTLSKHGARVAVIVKLVYTLCIFTEIAKYYYEEDQKRKYVMKKPLYNDYVPFCMGKLDSMVQQNNGYLANGKVKCSIKFICLKNWKIDLSLN